eukprot:UN00359
MSAEEATTLVKTKKNPRAWSPRRKKKKRKKRSALFTNKKVRTTTSNLRTRSDDRRRLYRNRCKLKKDLQSQGQNVDNFPAIDHLHPLVSKNKCLCKVCDKQFLTKQDLLLHLTHDHNDKNDKCDSSNDSTTTCTQVKQEVNTFPDITILTKCERKELLRRLLEMEKKENDSDKSDHDHHIKQEINIKRERNYINTSNIPILGKFYNNSFISTRNKSMDLLCASSGYEEFNDKFKDSPIL